MARSSARTTSSGSTSAPVSFTKDGAMHTATNFVVEGSNDAPVIHGYIVKFGMDRRPVEILGCAKLTGHLTRQSGRWLFEKLALAITLTARSPATLVK
jgi:hypothetical protein